MLVQNNSNKKQQQEQQIKKCGGDDNSRACELKEMRTGEDLERGAGEKTRIKILRN